MWIILNIIQIIAVVAWTVCSIILVTMWLPLKWNFKFINGCWSPVLVLLAGGMIRAQGKENLDPNKNYLFLCNHTSWVDIPVLFYAIRRIIRFIAKKELGKIPFLGFMMRRLGMIFVERGNARNSALAVKETLAQLKEGLDIVVFPEGTRSKTGRLGVFKKGVFTLAVMAEIDIVPVGIVDAYKVWPINNFGFRHGKIKVNIGKPISISGYSESNIGDLMDRVRQEILGLSEQDAGTKEIPSPSVPH